MFSFFKPKQPTRAFPWEYPYRIIQAKNGEFWVEQASIYFYIMISDRVLKWERIGPASNFMSSGEAQDFIDSRIPADVVSNGTTQG